MLLQKLQFLKAEKRNKLNVPIFYSKTIADVLKSFDVTIDCRDHITRFSKIRNTNDDNNKKSKYLLLYNPSSIKATPE